MGNCNQNPSNVQQISDAFIQLTVQTWSKESHGLFDYESPNITTSELKISTSIFLNLHQDNVEASQKRETDVFQIEIQKKGGIFWLQQHIKSDQNINGDKKQIKQENIPNDKKIYLNVNSIQKFNKQGQNIRVDDEIKLGRIRLKVKEFITDESLQNNAVTQPSNAVLNRSIIEEQKTEEDSATENFNVKSTKIESDICMSKMQCRICLGEGQEHDNPLVSPCVCIGSMKFVHYQCLSMWICKRNQSQDIKNTENCTFVLNNRFICELCKSKYPQQFNHEDQIFDLLDILRPRNCAYLISHICDVRITDISVSRQHAQFYYENNQFFVFDKDSKFGTLILLKENMPITSDVGKMCIQVGRHVFKLQVQNENKGTCCLSCCCQQNSLNEDQYVMNAQEQNVVSE